jgi:hypothetical protein
MGRGAGTPTMIYIHVLGRGPAGVTARRQTARSVTIALARRQGLASWSGYPSRQEREDTVFGRD